MCVQYQNTERVEVGSKLVAILKKLWIEIVTVTTTKNGSVVYVFNLLF